MSYLRSRSCLRLLRASAACPRVARPPRYRQLSQSLSFRIKEPDPKAIPSDDMQSTEDQASMVVKVTHSPLSDPDPKAIPSDDMQATEDQASMVVKVTHSPLPDPDLKAIPSDDMQATEDQASMVVKLTHSPLPDPDPKAIPSDDMQSTEDQASFVVKVARPPLPDPDPNAIPSNVMQSTEDQASLVTVEEAARSLPSTFHPEHQPDYDVHSDHGTSNFSPIPKRVMDGSEPGEVVPGALLSGAPVDLQARQVRIHKPTKPATQSGNWGSHHWRMDWDILQKGHRWENPLMGWQSSADFMQGTRLNFKTKEDAIAFAEKQGYEYFVQEPKSRRVVPKAYANNFLHESTTLKHIKTK